MTPLGWLGHKTSTQTNKHISLKINQIVYSISFPDWNFISPYKKVKMFILYFSQSGVSYLPTNKSNCLFCTTFCLEFHISLQRKKNQNVYSIPLSVWSFISPYKKIKMFILYHSQSGVLYLPSKNQNVDSIPLLSGVSYLPTKNQNVPSTPLSGVSYLPTKTINTSLCLAFCISVQEKRIKCLFYTCPCVEFHVFLQKKKKKKKNQNVYSIAPLFGLPYLPHVSLLALHNISQVCVN